MPRQRDAAEMMTLGNMGASQRAALCLPLAPQSRDVATAMVLLTQFEELQLLHIQDRDRLRQGLVQTRSAHLV